MRTTSSLFACLAVLDICNLVLATPHFQHRHLHNNHRGLDSLENKARNIIYDVVTETVYFTTYVEYVPPTSTTSSTSSSSEDVVVVYSTLNVVPIPVNSILSGLSSSGTPITNTFSPSTTTTKNEAKKKASTTNMKLTSATAAAVHTTLLTSKTPSPSAASASPPKDVSLNPSYANLASSAISAMSNSYSTSSLQWTNIHGWTAANVYNDILDLDFHSKTTTYSTPYGAALLSVATDPNAQGRVLSTDAFNDDQLWWCLAMLRTYMLYGKNPAILAQVSKQWLAIRASAQLSSSDQGHAISKSGITRDSAIPSDCDVNGGVYWSSQSNSNVNAISTSLFAQVGAWLFELTGDSATYRGPADAALGWLQRVMLDQSTGVMNVDSMSPAGCQKHPGSLTYNTGVYIGALMSFYRSTGDTKYRDAATLSVTSTAAGAFGNSANAPLVINQQSDIVDTGDDVQWRDVLFRNVLDYWMTLVPKGEVSSALQDGVKKWWGANLDAIRKQEKGGLYCANWFGVLGAGSDWGTGSVLSVLVGAGFVL